jgi:hypothetical protein
MKIVVKFLPEIFSGLLYIYLHPLSGADGDSGDQWQLVTAIQDYGKGGLLC